MKEEETQLAHLSLARLPSNNYSTGRLLNCALLPPPTHWVKRPRISEKASLTSGTEGKALPLSSTCIHASRLRFGFSHLPFIYSLTDPGLGVRPTQMDMTGSLCFSTSQFAHGGKGTVRVTTT